MDFSLKGREPCLLRHGSRTGGGDPGRPLGRAPGEMKAVEDTNDDVPAAYGLSRPAAMALRYCRARTSGGQSSGILIQPWRMA
jgi:hypothetical protein